MEKISSLLLGFIIFAVTANGAEFFVAVDGKDSNPGTQTSPFRTIQHAADIAQPGDFITVRAGVYRERVNPPRGGVSDAERIVYQATPGGKVIITGSEVVTNWVKVKGDVWEATLPNSFFGEFNPYTNVIHGDWFNPLGRIHHTGTVYLHGDWLAEATNLDEVMDTEGINALWFGRVDDANTMIWAQFKDANPNQQQVEINVRQAVFYPEKTGINYITVCGFTMEDAATPWSPPTAEQIGLIDTHWSRGWIIESNIVRYSMCSGISLGKYGDEWDNRAGTAEGYIGTINRALTNGWNEATIGHHIVRGNDISHCEQTGVVGSLGGAFSIIKGNNIHDIHVKNWFSGAEMAGIKLHGAIDVQITHNHIYRANRGIWLDWMAQGTRLTGNLFHDNGLDMSFEVDHGPLLVDNNIFLSPTTIAINSQGVAFAHNLFAGAFQVLPLDERQTPYMKAHSTAMAGLHNSPRGDVRYYNNIFVQRPVLTNYDDAKLPVWMDGNVYLDGAMPSSCEKDPMVLTDFNPRLRLIRNHNGFYLEMKFEKNWISARTYELVTSELLGNAVIPNLPFEQPDGMAIRVDTDYFGKARNEANPSAGPFEKPGNGRLSIKVWQKVNGGAGL
jgi:alpha-L-arabinofuranosidase